MERKYSRTFRVLNAFVTIHDHEEGSAILNLTSTNDNANIAIWVSREELESLGTEFLAYITDTQPKEPHAEPIHDSDSDNARGDQAGTSPAPKAPPEAEGLR